MKLLLDEHFSPKVARRLRARGHDVVAVAESVHLRSRQDRVHFATMPEERRAIVTQDLGDYRPLLEAAVRASGRTYGLVCVAADFPLSRRSIGAQVRKLEQMLKRYPGDDDLVSKMGGEDWLVLS